jgi:acetylornithine deacetylase/succinyl-diaminopimelate desuccinylase-like protein
VIAALADIRVGGGAGDPDIDTDWGEPGLTPEQRVFAWNTLEVLAFETGNPRAPAGAIPPAARATLQLRFVVGTHGEDVIPAVRRHLDAHGLSCVAAVQSLSEMLPATRLDPADPWVAWTLASIQATTGKKPALLPNLGGSLPNDVFATILGLPTIWIPHSYPACSQHAPNEHLLGSIAEESLRMMAGLFWDLGETGGAIVAARRAAPNP